MTPPNRSTKAKSRSTKARRAGKAAPVKAAPKTVRAWASMFATGEVIRLTVVEPLFGDTHTPGYFIPAEAVDRLKVEALQHTRKSIQAVDWALHTLGLTRSRR